MKKLKLCKTCLNIYDENNLLNSIHLSKMEQRILLQMFIDNNKNLYSSYNKLVSMIYDINLDNIKNADIDSYLNTLRVNINRLNKKLDGYVKIENLYGKGYRLIRKC